ncbi:hypothetical protein JNUCC0626_10920 [Lentzea sp. JNUCC 0626]|uniref:sunset domain-containing protein n=1 Tax=Lentzea sp. JNUCC 0626 TaxID=3367513 RepID=UPI00374831E1
MLWLFSQMFLLCLASFAVGVLVTWLSVRSRLQPERPKTRLALPAPRPATEQVVIAEQPAPRQAPKQDPLPVKGNSKTMVYHTPESPYYRRMKGDMTFGSEAEALSAGYRMWTTKGRVKA